MDFKKGGLCKLETEKLSHDRCATLVWLLTPQADEVDGVNIVGRRNTASRHKVVGGNAAVLSRIRVSRG